MLPANYRQLIRIQIFKKFCKKNRSIYKFFIRVETQLINWLPNHFTLSANNFTDTFHFQFCSDLKDSSAHRIITKFYLKLLNEFNGRTRVTTLILARNILRNDSIRWAEKILRDIHSMMSSRKIVNLPVSKAVSHRGNISRPLIRYRNPQLLSWSFA